MIQALLLVHEKNEELDNVIESWSFVNRIVIYLNNTNDETRNYLKTKNVIVHEGKFKNFSYARNRLLDLSRDKDYKYSIMLDDTYIFQGDSNLFIEELKNTNERLINIEVFTHTDKTKYVNLSKRIIKTNEIIKYVNELHEYINEPAYYTIQTAQIYEYRTNKQEQRTLLRNLKDIEILREKTDPRSLMYTAQTLFRLYFYKELIPNLKIKIEYVVEAFYKRILCEDTDYEEKFMAFMYLGHLCKDVRWYLKASTMWPDRCAESYYYASKLDKKYYKLYEKHKLNGFPKKSRLPYDIFIYSY